MTGKIQNLFIKENHGQPVTAVNSVVAEGGMGFVGDVSFGRSKRQILFIEQETLDEFGLIPGQVKENVTVRGVALAGLPAGTHIQVGDSLFEIMGDCAPCQYIEAMRPGLEEAMRGRRGTLCRVVDGGTLKIDDKVIVYQRQPQPANQ